MEVVAENEMGLLDLPLLVLGPLIVGTVAYGVAFSVPESYLSQAILVLPSATAAEASSPFGASGALGSPTPQQAVAMMVSPFVLDLVINDLGLRAGRSVEQARASVDSKIKATVGKDNLVRLDVTARSPADAQKLGAMP